MRKNNFFITFTLRQLINANLHYGSSIKKWEIKCSYFLSFYRNNIFLFDLAKSSFLLRRSLNFISLVIRDKGSIWSISSNLYGKFLKNFFERIGFPFFVGRYCGGLITNRCSPFYNKNRVFSKRKRVFPSIIFCPDSKFCKSLPREVCSLSIPLISVCDSNMQPEVFLYLLPFNNDSVLGLAFICSLVEETIFSGYLNDALIFKKQFLIF